ncbi:DUF362 domain-containing protein [bacterium]|nr:DUF362 domain-containing protein [bacterium]
MKRRDFIKTSAAAGLTGFIATSCSAPMRRPPKRTSGPGFDVHPFIREHPEAVFITYTDIESKKDTDAIRNAGNRLAREIIVKSKSGGYPFSQRITVKPNWTSAGPQDGKPVYEKLGINTDPNFIEGWVQGMREAGPQQYFIRECCCPQQWEPMGWKAMCERANIDLRDLSSQNFWELGPNDINFIQIPHGVVFDKMGFMSPMNEPDTFLCNIAKNKSHAMGITATIKNLQGITGRRFHQYCTAHNMVRKRFEEPYRAFLKKDFEKHIETLYAEHLKEGIPRWEKPESLEHNGIWMEQWVQRMLDSYSVTPTGICVIEAIYSQDGNGFGSGPFEPLGDYKVTSRDYMTNFILFGIDPFRLDIIAHWLDGHEPGNFGLFHIGIERGLSNVLDPHDIPIYVWKDGKAELVKLDSVKRHPLLTYFLTKDYNGGTEPKYHLCDEPFNYSAWKAGAKSADCRPTVRQLGRDARNNVILDLTLPEREYVNIRIHDRDGTVVGSLLADKLDAGTHELVWDGFASPGLYNVYVKGMGWDAAQQIVTYS